MAMVADYSLRRRQPGRRYPGRDRDGLAQLLSAFGSTVLRVVSDPAVTTLFRVAVAEAERTPEIAAALDSIGRAGNRAVLAAALSRAQQAGFLREGSPELYPISQLR
jgi:AefR-like transcriptional repressor, C-terminal domain